MQNRTTLIAAVFEGAAEQRQIQLLYADSPSRFLLYRRDKGANGSKIMDLDAAKNWIASNRPRVTLVADITAIAERSKTEIAEISSAA